MYKLTVSELAHQDLDSIISYIAVQLANPAAASNFLDEVVRCYGNLKGNPMMYSKCNDSRLEKEGYRKAVIKNYILVYKVDEIAKTVSVLRFFYGARDYEKLV
ncbi:MAG: hypothetical protein STSR0004_06420 [Peptococcaceae bacterium]